LRAEDTIRRTLSHGLRHLYGCVLTLMVMGQTWEKRGALVELARITGHFGGEQPLTQSLEHQHDDKTNARAPNGRW
jgi:hypothetical protein